MRNPIILGFITFVAACTGSIGEDAVDDTTPTPPTTNVQIIVQDGKAPQANVRVIFQAADDTVIAEAVTGADGSAIADMPAGGNLTVIRTFPPITPTELRPAEVYTYVGVKPGDKLMLGRAANDKSPPSAINVMVPEGAVGTVKIVTPCGSGTGTAPLVPITVRGCDPMVDFYVTDQDQSSFSKRTAYSENIDLSTESLLGRLSTSVGSINVAPNTAVSVEVTLVASGFELYSSGSKRVETTAAQINVPNISNVDQLVVTSLTGPTTQMIAEREAYSASPVIVDASANLLPKVAATDYSPTGISWTEEGPGAADFVIATLNVTREPGLLDPEYVRAIIAPHTGLTLRMPILPGADAIYNPGAMDQIAGATGIAKIAGGYDAVRARAFTVGSVVELAPADGTATLSYQGTAPSLD